MLYEVGPDREGKGKHTQVICFPGTLEKREKKINSKTYKTQLHLIIGMGFCRQLRPLAWNYNHSLIACCMRGFLYTPGVHCHPIIKAVLCSAEAWSGIGGFRLVLADSRSSSFSTEAPQVLLFQCRCHSRFGS